MIEKTIKFVTNFFPRKRTSCTWLPYFLHIGVAGFRVVDYLVAAAPSWCERFFFFFWPPSPSPQPQARGRASPGQPIIGRGRDILFKISSSLFFPSFLKWMLHIPACMSRTWTCCVVKPYTSHRSIIFYNCVSRH